METRQCQGNDLLLLAPARFWGMSAVQIRAFQHILVCVPPAGIRGGRSNAKCLLPLAPANNTLSSHHCRSSRTVSCRHPEIMHPTFWTKSCRKLAHTHAAFPAPTPPRRTPEHSTSHPRQLQYCSRVCSRRALCEGRSVVDGQLRRGVERAFPQSDHRMFAGYTRCVCNYLAAKSFATRKVALTGAVAVVHPSHDARGKWIGDGYTRCVQRPCG